MSAVKPMQSRSLRDSLSKTVRLLTRQGIQVQFRGHQPYVLSKGDKAVKLVLPELNDNASPELLGAIQGFLDHEVGHIYYTPFGRATKFAEAAPQRGTLANIIEDIRLEKLMPRDLPGTKDNLERMYENAIPFFFSPVIEQTLPSGDTSRIFCAITVVALRALAGQKAFQQYMDGKNLWPHFMPLMSKMPNLARRLKEMETYSDVEAIVDDIIEALKPPPAPEKPKREPKAPPPPPPPPPSDSDDSDDSESGDDEGDNDSDDTGDDGDAGDDKPDDKSGKGDKSNDDADTDESGDEGDAGDDSDDDAEDDEANAGGGEGHGDGEGTDDEEGDADEGSCSGDEAGDDEGDPKSGDDAGDDKGDEADDADDEDGEGDADESDDGDTKSGKGGKKNLTITDALKQLLPTQREALFRYKQRKQSVETIATEMSISQDEAINLLRNARRKLAEVMKGD